MSGWASRRTDRSSASFGRPADRKALSLLWTLAFYRSLRATHALKLDWNSKTYLNLWSWLLRCSSKSCSKSLLVWPWWLELMLWCTADASPCLRVLGALAPRMDVVSVFIILVKLKYKLDKRPSNGRYTCEPYPEIYFEVNPVVPWSVPLCGEPRLTCYVFYFVGYELSSAVPQ